MKFQFLALLWIVILSSCHKDESITSKYFDMDSLIDTQIKYLVQSNASVRKSASVDTVSDESNFRPTEQDWLNELAMFRQLDLINKPIYADAYELQDGEKDINSNLTVRSLNAKKNAPVRQFKIYYQEDPLKIRKIEATVIEQNSLYFTSRRFSIDFENHRDKPLISNYSVKGTQKMLLRDTVEFSIFTSVEF